MRRTRRGLEAKRNRASSQRGECSRCNYIPIQGTSSLASSQVANQQSPRLVPGSPFKYGISDGDVVRAPPSETNRPATAKGDGLKEVVFGAPVLFEIDSTNRTTGLLDVKIIGFKHNVQNLGFSKLLIEWTSGIAASTFQVVFIRFLRCPCLNRCLPQWPH